MELVNIYAHRGNINGPETRRENSPDYIDDAISAGFMVEVDVRSVGARLFLGHDFAQYPIESGWIDDRVNELLLHVKDVGATGMMDEEWHYFCHSADPFVLTSRGNVWINDLSLPIAYRDHFIIPLIDPAHIVAYQNAARNNRGHSVLLGVCSDYPAICRTHFK